MQSALHAAPPLVFIQPRDSQASVMSTGYPPDMFAAQKFHFTDDEAEVDEDEETDVDDNDA